MTYLSVAGQTGIEMVAELDDLAHAELKDLYPHVAEHIALSVHDVADNILGAYDKKLYEYANAQLRRRNIQIETRSHIERVEKNCIYTKEKGRIGCGMLVWATGNKNVPLVEKLDVRLSEKGVKRILTDRRLQPYTRDQKPEQQTGDEVHDSVYALGDAADIEGGSLPTTAEVAVQKAKYMVKMLNNEVKDVSSHEPFEYQQKQLVSYIGGSKPRFHVLD